MAERGMMQPERLARMVGKEQMVWLSGHVSSNITVKSAIKLLRREQARVRRITRKLYKTEYAKRLHHSVWTDGYCQACLDLLAALRNGRT